MRTDIAQDKDAIKTSIGPSPISRSGLTTINTPTKPVNIANHLHRPTFSLKNIIANNVAKIGTVKPKVTASARVTMLSP